MLGGGARRPPSAPISTCINASSFPDPSFPSQEPIPEPPFALSRVCDERRCAPPCDNPCGSGRTLSTTKEMKVFKCWKRSKTMQETQNERGRDMTTDTTARNTIIHGNCIQVMESMPTGSVDFILTDPPYIASYKSRDNKTVLNDDNAAWLHP